MSDPTLSAPPDALPRFEMQPASAALRDVVDHFWLMRLDPSFKSLVPREFKRKLIVFAADGIRDENAPGFPSAYSHQLVVPDGSPEILVHVPYRNDVRTDTERAYAFTFMPVSRTVEVAFKIPSYFFAVRFFPGGAREFFQTGIDALADEAIPLEEFWGSNAQRLADDVGAATGLADLASVAERYLLELRTPNENTAVVRQCVQALEKSRGAITIEELREISGLTARRLERLFKEFVGMSPKRMARTLRMDFLMTSLRNLDTVDWHDLVEALNYCDQPHLIREFRDSVGMSPASFRREMKQHLERKKRFAESQSQSDSNANS